MKTFHRSRSRNELGYALGAKAHLSPMEPHPIAFLIDMGDNRRPHIPRYGLPELTHNPAGDDAFMELRIAPVYFPFQPIAP